MADRDRVAGDPVRAVFLDRDGVLNRAVIRDGRPYPPESVAELEVLPGVEDALWALKAAGYMLIVVTNQPDVARGKARRDEVEAINAELRARLPLDAFHTCYHDNSDNCLCRKPRPGALLQEAELHKIDLSASFMVGDRWKDIEAGRRAGCKTIFIDWGYSEPQPVGQNFTTRSLYEAAHIIKDHKI